METRPEVVKFLFVPLSSILVAKIPIKTCKTQDHIRPKGANPCPVGEKIYKFIFLKYLLANYTKN